jgi:anti-sigma factor RsiW
MNESEYQALVEASWRRPLTADEQIRLETWVAGHPEARSTWESEASLNRLLNQLPEAPVASNFTARVLQAVDRELATKARRPAPLSRLTQWFRRPIPRVGWALLLLCAAWFGYYQHQTNVHNDMAKGFSVLANVATLSDPAVLQDFEAIHRLGQAAPSDDEELFAVLNQ